MVGRLSDDDAEPAAAPLFQLRPGAQRGRAPPAGVAIVDALLAAEHAAGREVGAGDDLHQLPDGDAGVIHDGRGRVTDLAQVVGRDTGGHADGNAGGAVGQQVGEAGGQHDRLLPGAVVVVHEVHRALLDVPQQLHADGAEPGLGVALGRRRVAVHRAEVALAVHQGIARGERLGHAHQGVVDGRLAVRVVVAVHVADDLAALAGL